MTKRYLYSFVTFTRNEVCQTHFVFSKKGDFTWQSGYCYLHKGECNLTNQKMTLLLNRWPRTIAETMATATKFMGFFQSIVLFSL